MAKKNYMIFIVLCFGIIAKTQNYILNPSFEEYIICPNDKGQIHYCKYWYNKGQSPDFYHQCGYYKMATNTYEYTQPPYDGQGVSGIGISFPFRLRSDTIFREYIMGTLIEPLIDDAYYFEAYILSNPINRTNSLGIYFTEDTIAQFNGYAKNIVPQITFNDWIGSYPHWKRHAACVDHIAGSQYLTIGNFNTPGTDSVEYRDINLSNLIHLDALGLYRIPKYSQMDTTVGIGYCHALDTIINGIPIYHICDGKIILKEKCFQEEGKYNIKTYVKGCDKLIKNLDLTVKKCDGEIICSNISKVDVDEIEIKCSNQHNLSILSFHLYDRWGNLVFQEKNIVSNRLKVGNLTTGVYIYNIEYQICNEVKRKIGDITIIK